jgi:hypothetical protein
MTLRSAALVVLASCLVACSRGKDGDGGERKFTLTVDAPPAVAAGNEATLVVRIGRPAMARIPVQLELDVPAGLKLLDGQESELVDETVPISLRMYRVAVEDPGAVLTITGTGTHGGGEVTREVRFDGRR